MFFDFHFEIKTLLKHKHWFNLAGSIIQCHLAASTHSWVFKSSKITQKCIESRHTCIFLLYMDYMIFITLFLLWRTLLFLNVLIYDCIYPFSLVFKFYVYFYTHHNTFRGFFLLDLSLLSILIVLWLDEKNLKLLFQLLTLLSKVHSVCMWWLVAGSSLQAVTKTCVSAPWLT